MANENDAGATLSWKVVAVGACSLVLTGGSYLVGDTLSSIRTELKDVRSILDQRSGLSPRLESAERKNADLERKSDDLDRRLREVEIRLGRRP